MYNCLVGPASPFSCELRGASASPTALRFDSPERCRRKPRLGRKGRAAGLCQFPGGFAVSALMHVAREIDNDGPAAARFLRNFHRACVGGVFGGVAGLTKAH